MILFEFDHERPNTPEEAVALLAQTGSEARLLAGGTDLIPNMRYRTVTPGLLVSLGAIAPEAPREEKDGSLRLDALSKLTTIEHSPLVRKRAPLLAESAHTVAGNQIRQMGTLGGNLCQDTRCLYFNQQHDFQFAAPCYKRGGDCCYPFPRNDKSTCWSVFMSDVAPALIALDATIEIQGEKGLRRMPLDELYAGDGLKPHRLGQAELLRAVIVPPAKPRQGWGYHKESVRGGLEFGMAVLAATVTLAADGRTCESARLALSAVREAPVRLIETEKAMAGQNLDGERIAQLAEAASQEVNPLPHHGFSKAHLRDAIRIQMRRLLVKAVERAGHPNA
jgi:4-hydroxybenzoyl-CoA reductase subunit beta